MEKTYIGWQEADYVSKQTEYTEPTKLLADDGTLLAKGWARRNVFEYDRYKVSKPMRRKEWDFYQFSDGNLMLQINIANISLGGFLSSCLVDIREGKTLFNTMGVFLGQKDKYVLPAKGDVPNSFKYTVGNATGEFITEETSRTIHFKKDDVECHVQMDIMPGLENITTVIPFEGYPDRYFMTTKQNSMPCQATIKKGDQTWELKKENSFAFLDWGRVCTPYALVWYWGNGSHYITDEKGEKHIFGFEITWGIGDERHATETCLFYDGKAHKIGAVEVKNFPKGRYMEPWEFVSQDGRFEMTMTPFYDHHSDTNALVMRMNAHQVHGIWNGTVTLDDGTKLEIKDMYAFCEYVENRW